jgi:hypothetical protein
LFLERDRGMADEKSPSIFSGLFPPEKGEQAEKEYLKALADAKRFLEEDAALDAAAWDERSTLVNSGEKTVLRDTRPVREMAEALRDQELARIESASKFVN